MACEIISTDGAVFSVWGRPTIKDADRIEQELRMAMEKFGGPVVYITRVPVDAPPPDAVVRQYVEKIMPNAVACCSSYHVILEGTGFMAALKRGILAGLFQIRWRRGTFFVHATTSEVMSSVNRDVQRHVSDILGRARAMGLLAAAPPISAPPPKFAA
jgi:hypothetical protein